MVQNLSKIDGKLIKNRKMVREWSKEAPRRHLGGSWEGSRRFEELRYHSVGAPGPPEKRLKFLYILYRE